MYISSRWSCDGDLSFDWLSFVIDDNLLVAASNDVTARNDV